MYDIYVAWPGWLSRVQLWLWQSKLRQVRQTICALNGERNWMGPSLPARNTGRNIMWPLTSKCLSTDKTPCVPGSDKDARPLYFSHVLLFQILCVYFSFPQKCQWKGSTQQFSSAGRQQNALPHHPLKAAPVRYLRWISNHSRPGWDFIVACWRSGPFIQVKIKVWLVIVLFNFVICFLQTGQQLPSDFDFHWCVCPCVSVLLFFSFFIFQQCGRKWFPFTLLLYAFLTDYYSFSELFGLKCCIF